MSIDVLRSVQRSSGGVVSTFNSYHDTGLPTKQWLTAGSGNPSNTVEIAKTQPASNGVSMHAWSDGLLVNHSDGTRSAHRAIPSAPYQRASASGGAFARSSSSGPADIDEEFVNTASSPAGGSISSDFFQDARDCAFSEGEETQPCTASIGIIM